MPSTSPSTRLSFHQSPLLIPALLLLHAGCDEALSDDASLRTLLDSISALIATQCAALRVARAASAPQAAAVSPSSLDAGAGAGVGSHGGSGEGDAGVGDEAGGEVHGGSEGGFMLLLRCALRLLLLQRVRLTAALADFADSVWEKTVARLFVAVCDVLCMQVMRH
jgi:hypothetical protein